MRRGHRRGTGAAVRSAVVAAVTVLVLVLVTGCDASSDQSLGEPSAASATRPARPTAASTPSPTPTPTADPAVVAPTPPAALTDVGADGASGDDAIAVAQYFVALYSYVYATHDVTAWSALSDPACVFCSSVVANSASDNEAGIHLVGGSAVIESAVVTVSRPGELFLVEGDLVQASSQTVDASGAVTGTSDGYTAPSHCALQYRDGRWYVLELNTD